MHVRGFFFLTSDHQINQSISQSINPKLLPSHKNSSPRAGMARNAPGSMTARTCQKTNDE